MDSGPLSPESSPATQIKENTQNFKTAHAGSSRLSVVAQPALAHRTPAGWGGQQSCRHGGQRLASITAALLRTARSAPRETENIIQSPKQREK